MKTTKKLNKGFTLVELLAVMFILVSVGGIVTSILISTLRNSSKGNSVNDVRQNGEFVIAQMSKMITYSAEFCGLSINGLGSADDCDLKSTNNTFTTDCTVSPSPNYSYIKIKSFDGGQTVFSCTGGTIASNGASMINASIFSVPSCSFTCSQADPSSPKNINISFTLNKINSGNFVENNASISFETSLTIRNN
jgi:prepilin-type N-terminal cleavage/methylation domain-containing protein